MQFDSCHNGTASRHSAQQRTQQAFYVVITPQLLITADIYRQRKLQQMNFVDRHSHRRQFHKQVLREIGLATHPNLVQLVVLASAAQYLAQIALLKRPDRPVLATRSPLLVQATRCEHMALGVVATTPARTGLPCFRFTHTFNLDPASFAADSSQSKQMESSFVPNSTTRCKRRCRRPRLKRHADVMTSIHKPSGTTMR